ncbi:hypothetical protein [Sinosporangium album]|uniref:hypothetical protein n=1 Tax=Sinosporangium album TaxID=504805 RepID=UPI0011600890|nr:hypothetical protein [Sinosporangium album]
MNLRLDWYPPGSQGNFSDHQLVVLRDIVAECEGVVRWGGDDKQPNESRIVIDAPPGDERLLRVAAKIRAWDDTPGQGAGTAVNPFDSKRRKAARAFQSRRELD